MSLTTEKLSLALGLILPGVYRNEAGLEAGLYETGTRNLIYSWEQLLGDEILEGGVVHVADGVVTTNATSWTSNASAEYLAGDLALPSDGSVTEIGEKGFCACDNLTGVYIPPSVTNIGSNAFTVGLTYKDRCFYINDMTAWMSMAAATSVAGTMYLNGKLVTEVTIPDGTALAKDVFSYIDSITSVTTHGNVALSQYAFCDCDGLKKIDLSEGTTLNHYAFSGCDSLTEVTIPNFDGVGFAWFAHCSNLASVTMSGEGDCIPSEIFYQCYSLKDVTMPQSIVYIYSHAFYECTSLTSIVIPASVREIAQCAFYGCTSLTSLTFEGTVEEWNAITLGKDWNTDVPATKVICSDGAVYI